jgi:hypothetical protein
VTDTRNVAGDNLGHFAEATMNTRCERRGQAEIGIVEHEGREFAAFGASVFGRHVTAYTKLLSGELALSRWCGSTMLACRSEVVQQYRDGSLALMFKLTRGNFVVGYALGDEGMLFRGKLLVNAADEQARRTARQLADHFAELDAEDERQWQEEEG